METLVCYFPMNDGYLFVNVDFGGPAYTIVDGQSQAPLPPPWYENGSSVTYTSGQWVTFWESDDYGQSGGDSLWLAPLDPSNTWYIRNLHTLCRPHGNNHWGDLIKSMSFSGPPTGATDDRTILKADG